MLLQSQSLNRQSSQLCLPDGAEYAALCSFTTPPSISIENNNPSKIPQTEEWPNSKISVLAKSFVAGYIGDKHIGFDTPVFKSNIFPYLRVTSSRYLCLENKM